MNNGRLPRQRGGHFIDTTFYSYALASLVYTLFGVGLLVQWRNRALSRSIIVCVVLTASWATVVAFTQLTQSSPTKLVDSAEAVRNGAWMFLLHAMYGMRLRGSKHILAYRHWLPWYSAGISLVLIHIYAMPLIVELLGYSDAAMFIPNCIMWLGFSGAVLALVLQIYRLSNDEERRSVKYLFIALVILFGQDFSMYLAALLTGEINPLMWDVRGILAAVTAPMIAVSIKRSMKLTAEMQVARQAMFHSLLLVSAGICLFYMVGVIYAIHFLGGTWGGVLQITLLSLCGISFVSLVLSARVRDFVRVWLSKHFFSYRYNYRREWLEFTDLLAENAGAAPRAVTRAMANLGGSPAGVLWLYNRGRGGVLIDHWHVAAPQLECDLEPLAQWLERTFWIIDLDEWHESPELYEGLEIPQELINIPRAWLIVPLMFTDRLEGILLLCRPEITPDMSWEDRDILKVAGRAAATHLAQYRADNALVELRQFEAFNRLSAYVLHDLKNILAQQSLIVFNAKHCRDEPDFLDDVIETVSNSVDRMKRLMTQMRSGVRGDKQDEVDLVEVLSKVIAARSQMLPVPLFECEEVDCLVMADKDQLTAVFGHLLQNAQEATPDSGSIVVRICASALKVKVEIEDDGPGMDEEFIQERLFKPFDTTKGLTGMGIGAYESREYVRRLGGDIFVQSTVGVGSTFCVVLPRVVSQPDENPEFKEGVRE